MKKLISYSVLHALRAIWGPEVDKNRVEQKQKNIKMQTPQKTAKMEKKKAAGARGSRDKTGRAAL